MIRRKAMSEYKVSVPEGVSGSWRVERFTVSEANAKFTRLHAALHHGRGAVPAGTYTKLTHSGALIMSDTPDEIQDHLYAIGMAESQVLINGLGLGVVVQAMLDKDEVERLTVIEISPDVISLVGSHYLNKYSDRLEIVEADAFTWKPPKDVRYAVVWHDVWATMCSDNLPEMHRLHRKYGRRADWQGSWGREWCEFQRDSW